MSIGAPSEATFPAAVTAALRGVASGLFALVLVLFIHIELPALRLRATESVIFGVLTPTLLVVALWRKNVDGRSRAIASLAALGWLPLVYTRLGTEYDELVRGRLFYGTLAVSAFSMALVLAVPALFGSILAATQIRHPRFDRVVRPLALASVFIVGLVTIVALSRAGRPSLSAYLDSLKVERTLAFGDSLDIGGGQVIRYEWAARPEPSRGAQGACVLEGVSGASFPGDVATKDCEPLNVAHARADDVWIVFGKMVPCSGAFFIPRDARNCADFWVDFTSSERRAHGLRAQDFPRALAPPFAWTVGGVVGFLMGLVLLVVARRAKRQESSVSGVEGTLREDGWVTLGAGPPIPLDPKGGLAPGPVLLTLRGRTPDAYREPGASDVESWQRGTLEEARAVMRARTTALTCLAITWTLLPSAPIVLSAIGWTR